MHQTNPHESTIQAGDERLIDLREYMAMTGESRTVAYERIAAGIAPKPVKDGKSTRFVLSEVRAYVARKIATLPRKA